MEEIKSAGEKRHTRKRGGRRSKKLSTRVDLTPMVDLGFLLITFFIFTTTMSRPNAMAVVLPAIPKPADSMQVAKSGVLTLVPVGADRLFYYEGNDPADGSFTDLRSARRIIIQKKSGTDPGKFVVILKPSAECTYRNVVGLLDEMLICDVKHYVMTDAEKADLAAVNPGRKQ